MAGFYNRNDSLEAIDDYVARVRNCALPAASLEDAVRVARDEDEEEGVANLVISGELVDCNFTGMSFERMCFINCSFRDCRFSRASWIDCLFWSSDFSNCNFENGFWSSSCCARTKGVGANFSAGRMNGLRFVQCNMQYSNFARCRLSKVKVEASDFTESAFPEANLLEFAPSESRFSRANFFHTPLKGVDWTTCEIDALGLSESAVELRNAVVNPVQAAELARLLGVIVKS